MTVPYATSEESRQSGAPLELYQFRVGARRGRAATPGTSGTVEVFRDEFEYADTAALLAAWAFNPRAFGDAECVLDPTGGVSGTKALRINIPAGTKGSHSGPIATRTITGLTPNAYHDLAIQAKLDTGFGTDPYWGFYEVIGLSTVPIGPARTIYAGYTGWTLAEIAGIAGTHQTATARVKSSSTGTITVLIGFGELTYFTIYHNASLWWDTLVVTKADPTEGDPGEEPTEGTGYFYTSADVDVVYAEDTYLSEVLIRSTLSVGGTESSAGNIDVRVPKTSPIAALAGGPPNPPVLLEIIRLHRADLTQAVTPWRGQVVRRRFEGATCVLTCAGLISLLERKIPRRMTQKMCHHILGDALCQVRLADFTTGLLTVSAIDGNVVTVDGAAAAATLSDSQWVNGVLTFGMIKGRVESFNALAGDQITLRQEIPGLIVGSQVTLTAGCDNQIGTCKTVFDNTIHYGGERVLPVHNPGAGAGIGGSAA